jgi:hypothetical protein
MFFSIDTKNRRIHEMVSSAHEIPLYTHEMTFVILFRRPLGGHCTKLQNNDEKVLELSYFSTCFTSPFSFQFPYKPLIYKMKY